MNIYEITGHPDRDLQTQPSGASHAGLKRPLVD